MSQLDKPVVNKGDLVIGTILPYATKINAGVLEQDGWLYCDGRAVSRDTYADLFAVVGTLHGTGDGVSTFNLPDYRGYFHRGVDDGASRDPDAGSRKPAAFGGASGDNCGSVQGYATAAPNTQFSISTDGDHMHTIKHLPKDNSSFPF